jgi:cell division protein FtsZ
MAFAVQKSDDGFELEGDFVSDTKIMVFGVGGGGGNAVANMVESGVNDVDYVVANTDVNALRGKDGSKMKRIQLGRKTTKGRGAGNNPVVGEQAAEESRDEIAATMDGISMIFIAAGMGGGTGTGAAPVVASVAKEKGILTVGVVTKPFAYEGASKMNQALKGIAEMKQYVDALIVIPNEKVKQLSNSKLTLKDAFKAVDDVLCKAVIGIITLLSGEGYLNVDFADVCMALRQSGIAHMAIGRGKGDNKIADAVDEVLNSPLLETSISGARRGLINISIPYSFPLDEYDALVSEIAEKFNADAEFKSGIVFDTSLEDDEVSVIAVATDFVEDGERKDDSPFTVRVPASETAQPSSGVFSSDSFGNSQDVDRLLNLFNNGKDM